MHSIIQNDDNESSKPSRTRTADRASHGFGATGTDHPSEKALQLLYPKAATVVLQLLLAYSLRYSLPSPRILGLRGTPAPCPGVSNARESFPPMVRSKSKSLVRTDFDQPASWDRGDLQSQYRYRMRKFANSCDPTHASLCPKFLGCEQRTLGRFQSSRLNVSTSSPSWLEQPLTIRKNTLSRDIQTLHCPAKAILPDRMQTRW